MISTIAISFTLCLRKISILFFRNSFPGILVVSGVLVAFPALAQLDTVHWLPPMHSRGSNQVEDHYVYLSTPSVAAFTVTITNGSGGVLQKVVISNASSGKYYIGTGGNTTFMVTNAELNTPLPNRGLILRGAQPFYANFRVRSIDQAEHITANGRAAAGKVFRAGIMPMQTDQAQRSFVLGMMAVEATTNIKIRGYNPGVVFAGTPAITSNSLTIVLNKGESYVISGYSDTLANLSGFTGALIEADNPIVINNGNWLGSIESTTVSMGQDIMVKQSVPIEWIGSDYILIKGNGTNAMEKPCVIAHYDNTAISIGGVPTATINAGQYLMINGSKYSVAGNMYIHTSKPAYMYQCLGGSTSSKNTGLNFIPPLSCGLPHEIDLLPKVDSIGADQYTSTLFAFTSSGAGLYINGVLQGGASSVPGITGWETYRIPNIKGNKKIVSTGPIGVGLFGFNGNAAFSSYFSGFGVAPAIATVSQSAPSCYGICDGALTATGAGGFPPYAFVWSNGSTTNFLGSTLCPGVYTATVTDNSGCTSYAFFTVAVTLSLTPGTMVVNNVSCNGSYDGRLSPIVTGGTLPYTYNWSNGQTTSMISNLAPGSYTVIVIDKNICNPAIILSGTIIEPPTLTDIIIVKPSCSGGSDGTATAVVNGGTSPYAYKWSNGPTTFQISGITPQTYTLTVTDKNGCSALVSAAVNQPAILTIAILSTSLNCNGANDGIATANLSGGTSPYAYNWSNGETTSTISHLTSTIYTVTITDNNGCSVTSSIVVAEPAVVSFTIFSVDAHCGLKNGSINIIASGGTPSYSYLWNTGNTESSVTGVASGSYSVTVTDAHSCNATGFGTINNLGGFFVAPIVSTASVTCFGLCNGALAVVPAGGISPYVIMWSNGDTADSISNLCSGLYTATVTDNLGCSSYAFLNITGPDSLFVTITANDASCFNGNDGNASANANGGTSTFVYTWSTGETTSVIDHLAPNGYTLTITDAHGCTTTGASVISSPPAITLSLTATDEHCNHSDGAIVAYAGGGFGAYVYLWNNGASSAVLSHVAGGNYSVTVTDVNECTQNTGVIINNQLINMTSSKNNVSCYGYNNGAIAVSLTGTTAPCTYNWSIAVTTASASGLSPYSYSISVMDANGCTATAIVVIDQPAALTTSVSSTLVCQKNNGNASVTVAGGISPYSYLWNSGQSTSTINYLTSAIYSVTVTDINNCTSIKSVNVVAGTTLSASVSNNVIIPIGKTTILVATGGVTYQWIPAIGLTCDTCSNPVARPLEDTRYCVIVTDENLCADTACVEVKVINCKIFVPNAFSPNGDNENDNECFFGTACSSNMHVKIFNRFGEMVFETTDFNQCWDGTYQGKFLNVAVFYYTFEATDAYSGNVTTEKGTITLMR